MEEFKVEPKFYPPPPPQLLQSSKVNDADAENIASQALGAIFTAIFSCAHFCQKNVIFKVTN